MGPEREGPLSSVITQTSKKPQVTHQTLLVLTKNSEVLREEKCLWITSCTEKQQK